MADLEFLGFVVTFFATLECSLASKASSIYSSGKKHLPHSLDSTLETVEEFVSSYFSPVREWAEKKGTACVAKVDELAASGYRGAKGYCAAWVPETAYEAHQYWVGKFDEVSETWREHGVLKGTKIMILEMYGSVKKAGERAASNPHVETAVTTVKDSPIFVRCKEYYVHNVQPAVSGLSASIAKVPTFAGGVWEKLQSHIEAAKNKVDDATDCIVAHPLYSKGVGTLEACIVWIKSTSLYSSFASHIYVPYLQYYVEPLLKATSESKICTGLVARLTPIKQE